MKIKKLFQVLVLGGATLGLGIAACGGDNGNTNPNGQTQTQTDGGTNPGGPPGW